MAAKMWIDQAAARDILAAAVRRIREARGRICFGDTNTITICGSCRTGEHQCGGGCHCDRLGCAGGRP